MKKTKILKSILSAVVCIVLIAVMGLMLTSCSDKKNTETPQTSSTQSTASLVSKPSDGYGSMAQDIGNGEKTFIFRVTDKDGYDTLFRVHTDAKTVGEALQEFELIEGEEGAYGLYVKKVNGIEADYDKDKTYWGFYIDNEYAMTGVDKTDVKAGAEYCFKVEKG